jgi:hypothetical protein
MGRENMSVFVDKEFFVWKKPKKKTFLNAGQLMSYKALSSVCLGRSKTYFVG